MSRKTSLTLSNRVEVYTNDVQSFYEDEDDERERKSSEKKTGNSGEVDLAEGDSVEIQI